MMNELMYSIELEIIILFFKIYYLEAHFFPRCDDFINLCEIHGKMMFTEPKSAGGENCCRDYFDPTPFFSDAGTCFTTKKQVNHCIQS